MRREILEGEHIARGKADDGVGIGSSGEFGKGGEDREEVFGGAVVGYDENEGTLQAALQQNDDKGFGGGGEPSDTDPPRALAQMGGRTPEGRE